MNFRLDPTNDCFSDARFCSEQCIAIETLTQLLTIDVLRRINTGFADSHYTLMANRLARVLYSQSVSEEKHVMLKDLASAVNAFTNLIKIHRLEAGKSTEIVTLEDLRKENRSEEEIHRSLLGRLGYTN